MLIHEAGALCARMKQINQKGQLEEKVERQYPQLRAAMEREGSGDAGFVENVLSGLGAGAVGMYESAALGGATLLEEEEELKARDKIKRVNCNKLYDLQAQRDSVEIQRLQEEIALMKAQTEAMLAAGKEVTVTAAGDDW